MLRTVLHVNHEHLAINEELDIQTIGLCRSVDQQVFVRAFCNEYRDHIKKQPGFNDHGKEWLSRLDELEETALETADPLHPISEAERDIDERKEERAKIAADHASRNSKAIEIIADELTRIRAEMKMLRHLRRSY